MQNILEWISDWTRRLLPNPQAVSFAIFLIVLFLLIISLGDMLMPVFAAGVIAYLLDGIVMLGVRKRVPRVIAVVIVYWHRLALTAAQFGTQPRARRFVANVGIAFAPAVVLAGG